MVIFVFYKKQMYYQCTKGMIYVFALIEIHALYPASMSYHN